MSPSRCGPLAAWFAAWVAGQVGIDEVVDAAGGGSLVDGTPLAGALVELRGGVVRAVFPVPGDVRGVPGPAVFRTLALELGEAVVGDGLALTHESAPEPSSRPSVWTLHGTEVTQPDPLTVAEAQHDLAEAMRETAGALTAAQVGGSSGATPDLAALRRAGSDPNLPRGYPPRAVALVAQAERLAAVVDAALLDPVGGAVDRHGISARSDALRPLAVAVRRARIAGYNALTETLR